MKMKIFVTLAKARLNIKSLKGSSLVVVRYKIDQVSRLWGGQYVSNKHNLLYKNWTAGRRRRRRRRRLKKRK
jgi:hypothetical protein